MRTAAITLMTSLAISLTASSNVLAEIAWQTNLRTAHAQAETEGKLLLLHFYTDNCTWCDQLEQGSFQAPLVDRAISVSFIPVKINAEASPKLTEMFQVTRFPTDVIVTTSGRTLSHSVSPQDPNRYVAMLSNTLPALEAPEYAFADRMLPQSVPTTSILESGTQSFLENGTQAQLTGTRNDAMPLEMPTQTNPHVATHSRANAIDTNGSVDRNEYLEQPDLAMQGFCAVTVITEDRWVEGKPEFGVIHLGKLYLFSTETNMKKFLIDPVPYTPVLNEIDVVRFFEERKIIPGKREWGLKDPIHNRMFFFADEAAMNHFYNEYERYTDVAIEVMEKAVKEANPGT
jgi:thiol-disulfide isomerase/thioredoxin